MALCSATGYMYGFDIYRGKSTTVYKNGLRSDVVIGFLEQVSVQSNAGHNVVFDNFFTSYY